MKTHMRNTKREPRKDVRVVVRMDEETATWLDKKAEEEDCSVGRIIRLAVRLARQTESFDDPDRQRIGIAA